jgi:hypothetical protein
LRVLLEAGDERAPGSIALMPITAYQLRPNSTEQWGTGGPEVENVRRQKVTLIVAGQAWSAETVPYYHRILPWAQMRCQT